ncbi:MAG: hypothetical protein ACJ8C4_20850 [Gemmataceae bacterium]
MSVVKLRRNEPISENLPPFCMCCGAAAENRVVRTFSWSPSWVVFLIFVGFLPFLIVAMILTKRARLAVPMCDKHKGHWRWRALVTWLSFAAIFGLGMTAFAASQSAPQPAFARPDWTGYMCVASLVLSIVWLIMAVVLQQTAIRPTLIDDYIIRLTGVSRDFAQAVHFGQANLPTLPPAPPRM